MKAGRRLNQNAARKLVFAALTATCAPNCSRSSSGNADHAPLDASPASGVRGVVSTQVDARGFIFTEVDGRRGVIVPASQGVTFDLSKGEFWTPTLEVVEAFESGVDRVLPDVVKSADHGLGCAMRQYVGVIRDGVRLMEVTIFCDDAAGPSALDGWIQWPRVSIDNRQIEIVYSPNKKTYDVWKTAATVRSFADF